MAFAGGYYAKKNPSSDVKGFGRYPIIFVLLSRLSESPIRQLCLSQAASARPCI